MTTAPQEEPKIPEARRQLGTNPQNDDSLQACVAPSRPRPGILEAHGRDDLLKSFKTELQKRPEGIEWRTAREAVVAQMQEHDALRLEARSHPALAAELIQAGYLPHPKQLRLMAVSADNLVVLQPELEIQMRQKGFFYLQALTHPALLESRHLLQAAGYTPIPAKRVTVFEKLLERDQAFTYEDFGLQPIAPSRADRVQESSAKILAQGSFSWISKQVVGFPTMSNSMPSTNSADALAALALIGTFAFLPTDGQNASLESRLNLLRRTQEVIRNHPVVVCHKHKDSKLSNGNTVQAELRSRTSFIAATLKQNPDKIVDEAKAFYDAGVRAFRIYDAGSTNQLAEGLEALKKALPSDITVLAGQVTGVRQARELVESGADGLIVGIGEGGICTTPVVGSLAPNNILVAYELCREELGVPIICDGGVGRAAGVIFAMGASGAMASRRIIGGTLEHSPVLYWIKRNGHLEKPYAGEASGVIKILGGNTTMVGDPYNMEGISSWVQQNMEYSTVPALYSALLGGFAKVVRFNRAHSLMDLQRREEVSNIKLFSDGARAAAGAHHTQAAVPLELYGEDTERWFSGAAES